MRVVVATGSRAWSLHGLRVGELVGECLVVVAPPLDFSGDDRVSAVCPAVKNGQDVVFDERDAVWSAVERRDLRGKPIVVVYVAASWACVHGHFQVTFDCPSVVIRPLSICWLCVCAGKCTRPGLADADGLQRRPARTISGSSDHFSLTLAAYACALVTACR